MTIDLDDILITIEGIRKKGYPEVPIELVKQIITTEAEYLEQRHEAAKRVAKLISDHVSEGDN